MVTYKHRQTACSGLGQAEGRRATGALNGVHRNQMAEATQDQQELEKRLSKDIVLGPVACRTHLHTARRIPSACRTASTLETYCRAVESQRRVVSRRVTIGIRVSYTYLVDNAGSREWTWGKTCRPPQGQVAPVGIQRSVCKS